MAREEAANGTARAASGSTAARTPRRSSAQPKAANGETPAARPQNLVTQPRNRSNGQRGTMPAEPEGLTVPFEQMRESPATELSGDIGEKPGKIVPPQRRKDDSPG
jgi:hypothetical protein